MAQRGDIFNSVAELNNWNTWSKQLISLSALEWQGQFIWRQHWSQTSSSICTSCYWHQQESDTKTAKPSTAPSLQLLLGGCGLLWLKNETLSCRLWSGSSYTELSCPKAIFLFFFFLFHFPRQKSCSFRSFRIFSSNWKSSGITPA